jgi:hypothetical protein
MEQPKGFFDRSQLYFCWTGFQSCHGRRKERQTDRQVDRKEREREREREVWRERVRENEKISE